MERVDPAIINHLRREQLHKDHSSGEIVVPSQRRSAENQAASAETEQEHEEQGRIKGILSQFALRVTGQGPELSGD